MTDEEAKLQAEYDSTLRELKRQRTYLEAEVERVTDGGEDSVDGASDVYEREKTLAIVQTLEIKLTSIERAMRALARGRYGICEMCGESIEAERLAIMPQSTRCVQCQNKLERAQRRNVA